MEEQKDFDEYKREISLSGTTKSRKIELIKLMQENLKQRCGKESGTVKCLNGKEYSLDSENVSELYAIDGAMKESKNREKRDEASKKARAEAVSRNKYNPDNPY